MLPNQPVQWLVGEKMDEDIINTLLRYRLDLDICYEVKKVVNKELVDRLHANNIKINCFVIDEKEPAEELIEMGVDFITTDVLE